MTTSITPTEPTLPLPDVAALRKELAQTQQAFQAVLVSLSPDVWQMKVKASAWSVGEMVAHLTWSVEQLPREIAAARAGRGMFNMPGWLRDPLNLVYTRWLARGYTLQSAAHRYTAAINKVDALLETIHDDEWHHGARFYGERFFTVEDLCHTPSQHLVEHQQTIESIVSNSIRARPHRTPVPAQSPPPEAPR